MRILPVVLLTAGVSACAQSASVPPATTQQQVRVETGDGGTIADVQLSRALYIGEHEIPVPRTVVWDWLPEVLQELGLPAPAEDAYSAVAVVASYTVTRQLGRERLSRYVDCGTDVMGLIANTHRVRLGVRTWLEPVGSSRTIVRTQLTAEASPMDGRGGSFPCTSSGALERAIAELLQTRGR